MKIIRYSLLVVLLVPMNLMAQAVDTVKILNDLTSALKSFKNVTYNYDMKVNFPNGDKDELKGTIYLNTEDPLYYNDCPKFTMIYSDRWFYRADHWEKTVTIIDLKKEDKKLVATRRKEIFKGGGLTTFLDSFLLKQAVISKFSQEGDNNNLSLVFKGRTNVKRLNLIYNGSSGKVIKCGIETSEPVQADSKNSQFIKMTMGFDKFQYGVTRNTYGEDRFFSCKNKKLSLKQHSDYKLSKKI